MYPQIVRLLPLAACLPVLLAAQDPKEIIRRAMALDQRNAEAALNYTFLQRTDMRQLDGSGKVKEQKIQTWDVTLLEGSPYKRLVARNDQPLSPEEQKWEQEKLRKSNEDRRKETEEQRQKRVADWRRKQQRQREDIREFPDAFDFRLAGEERLNGFDVWVIDATPHPGFRAGASNARALFPNVKGRFWVAKDSYGWVKADVEAIDTISLGVFLVRVSKGSRVVLEQTRVNGEVWLPKKWIIKASARIFLVRNIRVDAQYDFSEYKKFQADSRIVTGAATVP